MSPKVLKRRATYEDLEALPETLVGEILDGDLIASPRPASPHGQAAHELATDLNVGFSRGGGSRWWFQPEPQSHFKSGDILVPDIAGWRRERMPQMPRVKAFELVPDWVCEVISPSTARIDRTRKMRIYAREKVAHMWIVDPLARSIESYRIDGDSWKVLGVFGDEAERARIEPFESVELEIARWWLPEETT